MDKLVPDYPGFFTYLAELSRCNGGVLILNEQVNRIAKQFNVPAVAWDYSGPGRMYTDLTKLC